MLSQQIQDYLLSDVGLISIQDQNTNNTIIKFQLTVSPSPTRMKQKISNNVSLEHFKRPNSNLLQPSGTYIMVNLNCNRMLLALAITHIHRILKEKQLRALEREIDQLEIKLEEVAREFEQYNHQQTIKGVLKSIATRLDQRNSWQEWILVINEHPIGWFALIAYARGKGKQQLEKNVETYEHELIGNELQLLENYEAEVRNVPLAAIASSLNTEINVYWNGVVETIGTGEYSLRIEVNEKELKFDTCQNLQSQLTLQITTTSHNGLKSQRNEKSEKLLNSSVPKLGKSCIKCGKIKTTKFCQCRKSTPVRQSLKPFGQMQGKEKDKEFHPMEFLANYRGRQKEN